MRTRPVVLGIFSNKTTPSSENLKDLFGAFGNNTGNMLFSESLLKNIPGSKPGALGLGIDSFEPFDCVVLAAANWLNPGFDFGSLAEKLERTNLPIVAIGLGAQANLDATIPVLTEGTKRLIKLVSERSAKIGVRGEFSAEVLEHYGVTNVTVTGCPSLLLSGNSPPRIKEYSPWQAGSAVIGSTRHGFNMSSGVQTYLFRQAFEKRLDLLLQSELADMYLATGGTNNAEITEKALTTCGEAFGCDPAHAASYLRQHGKVFFEMDSWINYMSGKSIYVGTRLHGAIASLLSGIPAVLICHDTRTLEVAQVLKIPYLRSTDLDVERSLDVSSLYNRDDIRVFEQNYYAYRTTFAVFFEDNKIAFK